MKKVYAIMNRYSGGFSEVFTDRDHAEKVCSEGNTYIVKELDYSPILDKYITRKPVKIEDNRACYTCSNVKRGRSFKFGYICSLNNKRVDSKHKCSSWYHNNSPNKLGYQETIYNTNGNKVCPICQKEIMENNMSRSSYYAANVCHKCYTNTPKVINYPISIFHGGCFITTAFYINPFIAFCIYFCAGGSRPSVTLKILDVNIEGTTFYGMNSKGERSKIVTEFGG